MNNEKCIEKLIVIYCMGKTAYDFDEDELEAVKYAIDKLREAENE